MDSIRIRKNFAEADLPAPALYVCSTPIGNLGDVSERLLSTLRACAVVAAEDTRQTRKLLTRFDIHPPLLVSCHEHNQQQRAAEFIGLWQEGKTIAMVSDAGTPVISDPGWSIIDAAIDHGVPVVPIPGPSAILAALVGSNLPAQPFAFFGFLPRGRKDAEAVLGTAMQFPGTCIFYESPHRLEQTLQRLVALQPQRSMSLAKELTKKHETFVDGSPEALLRYVQEEPVKGEYVIVLGPPAATVVSVDDGVNGANAVLALARAQVHQELSAGDASHADVVRRVAKAYGVKRRDLYQMTLGRNEIEEGPKT